MTRQAWGASEETVVPVRRRRLGAHRRVRILLAAAALTLAACVDTAEGSATTGTLGSEQAVEPSIETAPVTVEEWSTDAPGGAPLTAMASTAEIRQAVEETHGRTSDVAQEVRRFAPFPDLPIVERALISELRADVSALNDGTGPTSTAEVAFSVDGSVDEAIEIFRADFVARGWVESADRLGESGGVTLRELTFTIPDTAYGRDDVLLSFSADTPLNGISRTMVRLRYVEVLAIGDPVAERFTGWVTGIPLPATPVLTSAGIHTSFVGRNTLHLSLATYYDSFTAEDVATQIRGALPAAGFSERPTPLTGDATDNWVHLTSDQFDTAWVSTQGNGAIPPSAANPTKVNVDARVDFTPVSP